MTTATLLLETDSVVVVGREAPGDTVFVTFNEMGRCADGLYFWGDRVFDDLGYPALGVVSRHPNWFPAKDMKKVVEVIKATVRGRKIVTYGQSQGGYGAVKYGRALGAQQALAFSPQWSILPADVSSFDNRFARYYQPDLQNGLAINQSDLCPITYIIYDPLEPVDCANARKILALRDTYAVVAPFSGHFAIRVLVEGGQSKAVLSCFRDTTRNHQVILRQAIRLSRSKSDTYETQTVERLLFDARRLQALTQYIGSSTGALKPVHDVLLLLAKRSFPEAKALLDKVDDTLVLRFELIRLWTIFRSFRFSDGEFHIIDVIDRRFSDSATHQIHVVNTLQVYGHVSPAIIRLELVVKLAGAKAWFSTIVYFAQALSRLDLAYDFLKSEFSLQDPNDYLSAAFVLYDSCRHSGNRKLAFDILLGSLQCDCLTPLLIRQVANRLQELGEVTYALDLRRRLLQRDPSNLELRIEVLQARVLLEPTTLNDEIDYVVTCPGTTASAHAMMQLGLIFERAGNLKAAEAMARKALSTGASEVECRSSLARIFQRLGMQRKTILELELLANLTLPVINARLLGDIATSFREVDLAVRFGMLQLHSGSPDIDGKLYLTKKLVEAGNLTLASKYLETLYEAISDDPSATEYQFEQVALLFGSIGSADAEQITVDAGLVRFPQSKELGARRSATALFSTRRGSPLQKLPSKKRGPGLLIGLFK